MTESSDNDTVKIGLSVWLSGCLLVCVWFLSSFLRGRRQFQQNLHVIEDGLKRMQEEIELRQRQKSIGYVENIEEILGQLDENNSVDSKLISIFEALKATES